MQNHKRSAQTAIGVPTCGIWHASGHGGKSEHQAGCWPWKTTKGAPKLQLENPSKLECAHASLGMHQGMEVNVNIKQAAGNGKPQKEHPNHNWSACTWHWACIRHGGEHEHQAGCWQWKTTKGAPNMHQGMEVNPNIKQAAGNKRLQKEHTNCNWSAQTTMGVPTCDFGAICAQKH